MILLPSRSTPFFGRQEELAEIGRLLDDPACRLLVLVGPGGIGKTRLAVEAAASRAASFGDGVYFVPLQPLTSVNYLVPTIAEVLQLPFSGQRPAREQLIGYLADKQLLLLLDNFEHLVAGVDLLPAILASAPGIKLLVTSREVLGLREEWVRAVDGLSYPAGEDEAQVMGYASVQLFAGRARQVRADFDPDREWACVVQICRLVQGVPLAIELAAAWIKALPCADVAGEIKRTLDFLATTLRDVPERHRSMRAVFEQSLQQLGTGERDLFERLSAFQGGFRRSAAVAIAGADPLALQSLVDKSLLRLAPSGRYSVHEVLRQFAIDRLDGRPEICKLVQDRHAAYYTGLLAALELRLRGSDPQSAMAEIDAEIDNVRAAWQWAAEHLLEAEIRQSMGSLLLYYQGRSRTEEGAEAFDRAIALFEASGSPLLAELYAHGGWFNAEAWRHGHAAELYRPAISELREREIQPSTSMALAGVTFLYSEQGLPWQPAELEGLFEDRLSRYRQTGDRWGTAWSLYALGVLAYQLENDVPSERFLRESIELLRAGHAMWASTWPLNALAGTLARMGRYEDAIATFSESLAISRETGDQGGVTFALGGLGAIAATQREYASSQQYLFDAIRIAHESRRESDMCWQICALAETLWKMGRVVRAAELVSFAHHYSPTTVDMEYVNKAMAYLKAKAAPAAIEAAWQRGAAYTLPAFMSELAEEYGRPAEAVSVALPGPSAFVEPLTPRELELLALVAAGLSNRDVAAQLVITVGAVKKHLNNIFGKLQVQNRTQAAARARALGLLGPDA